MVQGITQIKNIAKLSGFSDPLYFSTVFKQKMGVSPKDYLKTEINKNGD
jgi:AraC-like DNA-binding protein